MFTNCLVDEACIRRYQGTEYDERATQSWAQTWFCAPNVDAGLGVLAKMAND